MLVGFFVFFVSSAIAELKIETVSLGSGEEAQVGMTVSVHYTGKLEDGTVFDSSRPRGEPFNFILGQGRVIKGWEQGILGMLVGEMRVLTIPSELGYGANGAGELIPPDATLIFEVELLDVNWPPQLLEINETKLIDEQKKGGLVIDIRRKEEWIETGFIEGSELITAFESNGALHPEFQSKFFSLIKQKDTPIILYCRSGNRSRKLGDALVNQVGLTNVSHLEKGILGWMSSGYETVSFQEND
jgi:rhodanese-related sulfurtransferase